MLSQTLEAIAESPLNDNFLLLERLFQSLRPGKGDNIDHVTAVLHQLCDDLAAQPRLLIGLQTYIDALLLSRRHLHLYADTGILASESLAVGVWRCLNERLLPPLDNHNYLADAFSRLTRRGRDAGWIEAVPNSAWARLFALLLKAERSTAVRQNTRRQQLDALRVLAHRISAIGLEAEFVRNYPAVEDFESPFLALSNETERFVRHQRELMHELREEAIDHLQMQVLMDQCHDILRKVRQQASKQGVSVSLTYLLVRLEQNLQRMTIMLHFITGSEETQPLMLTRFFKRMAQAEHQSRSIRALFSRNTELLARNITAHASEAGDHYITDNATDFFAMWRSASRAGLIIAVMALLKILSARLVLAPFSQAFVYSMNYSFGFMLIHVMHGTIATKQPAMTAAHIAASIEDVPDRKSERHLDKLALLCVDVFRSQCVAIMGNIGVAFPLALLISMAWLWLNGSAPVSPEKSLLLLEALSPIDSLAIFHAAIAGVFLFLSGIISGYYDNLSIYSQTPERLTALPIFKGLSDVRRQRLTLYLRHNLGALAGNFYFGIMLGSMSTVGYILGLPLDIRHIAFAAANFASALVALDFHISGHAWLISLLGIAAIGLTNLAVSFTLALMLALKSRGVQFRLWRPLLKLIFLHFCRHPRDFFWPPKVRTAPTH